MPSISKIFATLIMVVLLTMSKSKNPTISEIGEKMGCGLLIIGLILYLWLLFSGEIVLRW